MDSSRSIARDFFVSEENLLRLRDWKDSNGAKIISGRYDIARNVIADDKRAYFLDASGLSVRIPLIHLDEEGRDFIVRARRIFPRWIEPRVNSWDEDFFLRRFSDYLAVCSKDFSVYQRNAELLRRAALGGGRNVETRLKRCLEDVFKKQFDAAGIIQYLIKSSMEDSFVQFALSEILFEGVDCPGDVSKSIELLKLSADQGFPPAQFTLAERRYWGVGIEEDEREAVRLYRAASEKGTARAQYKLGLYLSLGRGCVRNESEAAFWFQRAKNGGFFPATEALENIARIAGLNENSFNNPESGLSDESERLNADVASFLNGETSLSSSVPDAFARAIAAGDDRAAFLFGLEALFNEKTLEKDRSVVLSQFEKVSERARPLASYYLAFALSTTRGRSRDDAEGPRLLKYAAERGVSIAKYHWARYIEADPGANYNPSVFFELYRAALLEGVVEASVEIKRLEGVYAIPKLRELSSADSPPPAVDDLEVAFSGGSLYFRWTPPKRGSVVLFLTSKKIALGRTVGVATLDELSNQLGAPVKLRPVGNGTNNTFSGDPIPGSPVQLVLPATVDSDVVSLGKVKSVVVLPPVSNVFLRRYDRSVYALWDWAPQCDKVLILSSFRGDPYGPTDPNASKVYLSRADYEANEGMLATNEPERATYFKLFQVLEFGGRVYYSEPASFSTKLTFISYNCEERQKVDSNAFLSRAAASFGLSKLAPKTYEGTYLVLQTEDGSSLPEIIVVRQRNRPPLRRDDGETIATIPASSEGRREIRIDEFFSSSGLEYFRCYLSDRSQTSNYALLDPPDVGLRLFKTES